MMRSLGVMIAIALMLALAAAPVVAQTQQPTQRPAPGAPAPEKAPGAPATEKSKGVEGTVKKVDVAAKTVQVSAGPLGVMGTTIEVAPDTLIMVEGKPGTLADIREGAKVKASYETRNGKNLAKSIDVMPADKDKAGARPAAPKTQ